METTENNKLIAEFMGKQIYQHLYDSNYHDNWNWLMPVIEKIEFKGFPVTISQTNTRIDSLDEMLEDILTKPMIQKYSNTEESTKLDTTYKAVVEFINWYNKQN